MPRHRKRTLDFKQRAEIDPTVRTGPGEAEVARTAAAVAAARERVLASIGVPDDLHAVDVRRLWDDRHFRVNVYRVRKGDVVLAHSYFLSGDHASPPLVRVTHDDVLAALTAAAA